jgi:hypothetical protein
LALFVSSACFYYLKTSRVCPLEDVSFLKFVPRKIPCNIYIRAHAQSSILLVCRENPESCILPGAKLNAFGVSLLRLSWGAAGTGSEDLQAMVTIEQYSLTRVGKGWTLDNHYTICEIVRDNQRKMEHAASQPRQMPLAAPETAQGAIEGHPDVRDIQEIYERLS